ncbi:MAG: hypothetical protein AAGG69_11200 [Pseudomonadota bacterium]
MCRALVAVGLKRAPENLFHPRYANAELVKKLSAHDQNSVMQYAVWAINENARLGIDHLAFELSDLPSLAPSIRGWTYRLYDPEDLMPNGDLLPTGRRRMMLEVGYRESDLTEDGRLKPREP